MLKLVLPLIVGVFLLGERSYGSYLQWGELGSGDTKVTYSYSFSEGQEALFNEGSLAQNFAPERSLQVGFGPSKVNIKFFKIEKKDYLKKVSLAAKAKGIFNEEYKGRSTLGIAKRHFTFLITSGASVYLWSKSGYTDWQTFAGASLSLSVNALFIYMEDFFDLKVYRNRIFGSFAEKLTTTYLKLERSLGIGRGKTEQGALGSFAMAKSSSSRKPKTSEMTDLQEFYEMIPGKRRKDFSVFLGRFLSASSINLLLITSYELITKDLQWNHESLSNFTMEVFLKLGAVAFVGTSYSLVRGYMKDRRNEGLLSYKFVESFAMVSRIGLSAAYVALFTELVSKSNLMMYLGAPGWAVMGLVLVGADKAFLEKLRASQRRQETSKQETQTMMDRDWSKQMWSKKASNYKYLSVNVGLCSRSFGGL